MDNIKVRLQDPFSYALWPIILLAVLVSLGIIYYLVSMFVKKRKDDKVATKQPIVVKKTPEDINSIKQKYLKELGKIANDLSKNKLNVRSAYQKMSICIRKFVFEVTGIKVQNYTLQDIKTLNMPMLETLISEYYAPEFSKNDNGNVGESLMKTQRVIEEWK